MEEYIAIPKTWMEEVSEKLDRIERNTLARPKEIPVMGKVLSAETVAEMLGVKKNTIYMWAREGKIRSVHTGGRVLFPDTAVREFMEGGSYEHNGRDET